MLGTTAFGGVSLTETNRRTISSIDALVVMTSTGGDWEVSEALRVIRGGGETDGGGEGSCRESLLLDLCDLAGVMVLVEPWREELGRGRDDRGTEPPPPSLSSSASESPGARETAPPSLIPGGGVGNGGW